MACPSNALFCHLETPCRHVHAISASVQGEADGALRVAFGLEGNIHRLRIPPPETPRRAERLWEHTCFEAFIAPRDAPAYYEFNFAPSGQWAAYAFRRYRDGKALELDWYPALTVRRTDRRLELEATIRLDRLPAIAPHSPLRLALSAVIEDEEGERSYWALRHPPGPPDFHHPAAFVLAFDPAEHLAREAGG